MTLYKLIYCISLISSYLSSRVYLTKDGVRSGTNRVFLLLVAMNHLSKLSSLIKCEVHSLKMNIDYYHLPTIYVEPEDSCCICL